MNKFLKILTIGIASAGLISQLLSPAVLAQAATVTELQQKIDEHSSTIKQLQDEISQYNALLDKTTSQAKTLQSSIKALEINSKKLADDIKLTQTQIDSTSIKIEQLGLTISDKQARIDQNKQALEETVKQIHETDGQSPIETMLIYPHVADFFQQVESIQQFQSKVKDSVDSLQDLTQSLVSDKNQTEVQKSSLVSLKSNLSDQKTAVEVNKNQAAQLLTETKNQESNYQKIIADKKAKEQAFESELNSYEAQLKLAVDPNSYPTSGSHVLSWPLDRHVITQYFGNTDFAQAHAAVYSGQGHNGIDLAASIGTPVKAALDGVVKGTGNTDLACPGASFGQWVFIEHSNGLSTLYAHLSVIKAVPGQNVSTGDVIGLSGVTGYATGPHLHFTVYASQGVKIMSRASKACNGGVYTMPIADLKAYLNPLEYL